MNDSRIPGLPDVAGLVMDRARSEFVEWSSMLAWAESAEAEAKQVTSGWQLQAELSAIPALIGEATHLSAGQVSHRLAAAERVRNHTPSVWAAFAGGRVDASRVREIGSAIDQLQRPASRKRLDARVVAYAERHTVAELRRWLKVFVANAEADLMAERAEDERKCRCVEVNHGDDGMSLLSLYDTSIAVAAIDSRLTKSAKALGADDDRTLQQRRADVAVSWLTTGELGDIHITADVAVTIPAEALAGFATTPAVSYDGSWVAPPAWVAELASHPDVYWHRMVLEPVTDDVLAHEYLGRFAPETLAKAMAFRDGVCQAPGCLRPALLCDQDHREPHEGGGPTTGFNMGPLCRRHHKAKGHGILTWSWNPDPVAIAA